MDFSQAENLTIVINNKHRLHVPIQSLIKPERILVNSKEQNNCVLMVYYRSDTNDKTVILGNSFFENYYVTWDFDQMKIGFNGYAETLPDPPTPPPKPPSGNSGFPVWATILLILIGLATIGAISYFLYRRR